MFTRVKEPIKMDFGKVPAHLIDTIDFKLPEDPATNKEVLSKGKGNTKYYVGLSVKGKFTFTQYSELFNAIEYSGSFYGLSASHVIEKQATEVPKHFKFVPKMLQSVTHLNRLKGTEEQTKKIQEELGRWEEKLGPYIIGLHPGMGAAKIDIIQEFLKEIYQPAGIEPRHETWFKKGFNPQLLEVLCNYGIGTVITDTAGRRDAVHMHLSTPVAIIRFVGNSLHPTDYTRIEEWLQRIKQWSEEGLEECYFFVHQPDLEDAIELGRYVQEKLG
jgi:uncharacterized protein YecE (DUF72 family)